MKVFYCFNEKGQLDYRLRYCGPFDYLNIVDKVYEYWVNGEWIESFFSTKNPHCFHREDGPAIIHFSGQKFYYLDGKQLAKEEWEQKTGKK